MKKTLTLILVVFILCLGVYLKSEIGKNKMPVPQPTGGSSWVPDDSMFINPRLDFVPPVSQVRAPAPSGPSPAQVQAAQQQAAANAYAVQQAQAEAQRVANIRNQINMGQENAANTGRSAAAGYGDSYRLQNQNIVNNYRTAANSYNSGRENATINLRRGISGVTQGVRQGLQGAMTSLPDSALDSGAAPALARSWNKQGQSQAAGIYQQNAQVRRDLDTGYGEAVRSRDEAIGNLGVDRNSKIDAISNQLINDLRTIDMNASAQGVGGAVNFGLRDSVINNAIARLNQLDQERAAGLGSVPIMNGDEITAKAILLDQSGQAAYNPYTLPDETGSIAVAPEGPATSQLPIYLRRRDTELGA